MADRLVDGQPQVRRVDDQVVAAGLDRRARPASRPAARAARPARRVPVPAPVAGHGRYSQPRPTGGASVRMVSNRPLAVDRRPRSRSGCIRTRCWVRGAGQVGVELVLLDREQRRVDVVDAVAGQQPGAPVGEQRDLLGVADVERVDLVRRDPADLAVRRLGGQLDPLGVDRGAPPGRPRPPARRPGPPVRRSGRSRRRSPRCPSTTTRTARPRSSASLSVSRFAVRQADLLAPDALDAEVGVLAPSSAARCSAASASSRSGYAVNSGQSGPWWSGP